MGFQESESTDNTSRRYSSDRIQKIQLVYFDPHHGNLAAVI